MTFNRPTKQPKQDSTDQFLNIFWAAVTIVVTASLGWFVYTSATNDSNTHSFKLGLDLAGGSHLVYEADVSAINPAEVTDLMNVLRDVIERRVNVFGVSEPIVQIESSSFVTSTQNERLVVELPGVTDVDSAVAEIGRTPLLEFKLVDQQALAVQESIDSVKNQFGTSSDVVVGNIQVNGATTSNPYLDTGLTGRYLESAALEFAGGSGGQLSNEPIVSIVFNADGAKLFETITRDNRGENLAIFLDGDIISAPRINEAIVGGRAIISGGFTPDEARSLAQNLNFGALPVPITLISTQTVGASLGGEVLQKGIMAGVYGLLLIVGFMLVWYRLTGVVAIIALLSYIVVMLSLFLFIPVTLTAAGLAGFILSLGMAVDANVLVFERMKEEYHDGKTAREAGLIGFSRAWSAIRDGNITSLLSAIILFWFGTSIVKGFALIFGLGVVVSMLTALLLTRTLLKALPDAKFADRTLLSKLFTSGF